jgi:hypothetical protein
LFDWVVFLHHLREIEEEIQTDPDIGYVLRKGEA